MSQSESQSTYATRIYAFGSTRNIPADYRPIDETVVVDVYKRQTVHYEVSKVGYVTQSGDIKTTPSEVDTTLKKEITLVKAQE